MDDQLNKQQEEQQTNITDTTEPVEEPQEEHAQSAEPVQEEQTNDTQSTPQQDDSTTSQPVATIQPDKLPGKWYIVHTYSGHENKVAKTLMQRVQSMGFEDRIFDVLVPTRETIKIKGGKKESVKEKIFPGYIIVRMDLSDEAWVLVRTTPGVTSFVGAQNKPTPIREEEVNAIVKFVEMKEPVFKSAFSEGEAVKITDGPFNDFLGTIQSIDQARGKVKVLVSIFGRETPVELDFLQIAKI